MKSAFDHCSQDYAIARPGYPAEVFDRLEEAVCRSHGSSDYGRVADVGAGTGIFSRLLAGRGWSVVAIDPSEAMLREGLCELSSSEAAARAGAFIVATAENTALAAACCDMVTVAQAFHWFNPPLALAELARILRPGGILALIWNNRDPARSAFVEQYERLIAAYNPAYQREYRQQNWESKIMDSGRFNDLRHDRIEWTWQLPVDQMIRFSRSASYIRNVLSHEAMARFERDLRQLADKAFATGNCLVPMWTDLFTARKKTVGNLSTG